MWQRSHQLRLQVYRAIKAFPLDERFGLSAQLRRSIASIPANIAESCGYRGRADSARFIYIAIGSDLESQNHLIAAADLGYLEAPIAAKFEAELEEIRRMLVSLARRMQESARAKRESSQSLELRP